MTVVAEGLKPYLVQAGGRLVVSAKSAEDARWYTAERLHYEHKPWLVAEITVREASQDEVDQFVNMSGRTPPRAPERKDRSKP